MRNQDCSILVLSCDKNISLLNILFDFFQKFWKDCPFPIFLGIETAAVNYNNVIVLNSDKLNWGERVLGYLEAIESDYVMLILDDFLPEKKVDTQRILDYLIYIKQNKNIATISFADIFDKCNVPYGETGLCKRKNNANYLLNLQVGIWDKKILSGLMKKEENPWQTELFGSIRARRLDDKVFLCLESDDAAPYKYGRGWLMVRGVWNGNEIRRLGLQEYSVHLFDGKDIIYSDLIHNVFFTRASRRLQIEYRKILSHFKIYL